MPHAAHPCRKFLRVSHIYSTERKQEDSLIKLIPIEVECHSGYKADEYPKYFLRDNDRIEIRQVKTRQKFR
jgi:hypothetical protein